MALPVPPLPPLQLAASSNAVARNGNINFAPYPTSQDDFYTPYENGLAALMPAKTASMVLPGLVLLGAYLIGKKL